MLGKPRQLAAVMLLLVLAAAAPVLGAANRTIDGSPPSVAGQRLSFSYAKAREMFGKPSSLGKVQSGCFEVRDARWRRLGLKLSFAGPVSPLSRRARAIIADVTSSRWSTPKGLQVGDDESEVKRLYPDARDQGAGYWQLEFKRLNDTGQDVLQARAEGGKVTHLAAIHGGC